MPYFYTDIWAESMNEFILFTLWQSHLKDAAQILLSVTYALVILMQSPSDTICIILSCFHKVLWSIESLPRLCSVRCLFA